MNVSRQIGYYVHHHGTGHLARARVIADEAPDRLTLLGTGLAGRVGSLAHIDLSDDRLPDDAFAGDDRMTMRPRALHYAPLDHAGIRARVAAIARWIEVAAPALLVVDVSVEVAMLARLASVPTVVVRLGGARRDAPHLDAFRSATALMSPFAAQLEDPRTPADIVARTHYAPGLCAGTPDVAIDGRRVTVVLGSGGGGPPPSVWIAAAQAVPGMDWHVLGHVPPIGDGPANLTFAGWVDDAPARIARSAVVVGGGDGVISAVLRAPQTVRLPSEARPFDEQRSNADALARAGAAIVCDDACAADWPVLMRAARSLDPAAVAALDDPDGPRRTAAWLIDLADRT